MVGSALATPSVGCEYYNATLIRCENNGGIEPVTFVDVNGINLFNNNTNRSGWTEYDWGFEWTGSGGVNRSVSWNALPAVAPVIRTNNLTYWMLNWTKTVFLGTKTANLTLLIGQRLNDSEVELKAIITTGATGWESWNRTIRMYRTMNKTNIDLDYDEDILQIDYRNKSRRVGLNRENDTKLYSLDSNYVLTYDEETDHAISWRWESKPNIDYHGQLLANPGQPATIYWVANTSVVLKSNKTYSLSHYWIDASTQINPQSNKTGYIYFSGLSYTAYGGYTPSVYKSRTTSVEKRAYLSYDTSSIENNAVLTKLEWKHNYISSSTPAPRDWRARLYMGSFISDGLNINDWNSGTYAKFIDWSTYCGGNAPCIYTFDLGSGAFKYVNRTGYTDVALRDYSLYDFFSPSSWSHNFYGSASGRSSWLKATYDYMNITLSAPANKTELTDEKNWVILECNWTVIEPGTFKLYINNTLNYTSSGKPVANISINVSFDPYGIWEWDCQGTVTQGVTISDWSWNGNRTIIYNPEVSVIKTGYAFKHHFIDRSFWR